MIHLDLFSGIGGFAYAADQVFGDVTHVFCDNEPFSQAVLRKHWPESYIFNDIREITADTIDKGLAGRITKQQTARQRSQRDRHKASPKTTIYPHRRLPLPAV
jgi:site-specific DNA-cytosine methylase